MPEFALEKTNTIAVKLLQNVDARFKALNEFAFTHWYHQDENDQVLRSRYKYVHLKTH